MFVSIRRGSITVTIAIALVSMLGTTVALAGRATGLPHYADSAPPTVLAPIAAPLLSTLSSAERLVKLEADVQVLRIYLKNVAALRTLQCAL